MQNLYDVSASEDGLTYTFTTRFQVNYRIALTTYPIGQFNAFCLSLYPDVEPKNIDFWIRNTVVKLIGDILNQESQVIFYTCDNEDSREDKRHNLFEYWYNKSSAHFWYIEKHNCCFETEHGYKINSSLLYNIENPMAESIKAEFEKALKGDN